MCQSPSDDTVPQDASPRTTYWYHRTVFSLLVIHCTVNDQRALFQLPAKIIPTVVRHYENNPELFTSQLTFSCARWPLASGARQVSDHKTPVNFLSIVNPLHEPSCDYPSSAHTIQPYKHQGRYGICILAEYLGPKGAHFLKPANANTGVQL